MSSSRLPFTNIEGETDELKDVHGLEVSGCGDRFPELIHVRPCDSTLTADGKFMKVSLRHAVDESPKAGLPLTNTEAGIDERREVHGLEVSGCRDRFPIPSWDSSLCTDGRFMKVSLTHFMDNSPKAGLPLTNIEAGTNESKDAHGLEVGGGGDRFPELIHVRSWDSSLSPDGKLMKVSSSHTVDNSPRAGLPLTNTEAGIDERREVHELEVSGCSDRFPKLIHVRPRESSLSADETFMQVSPTHTVDESPKAGSSLTNTEGLEASVRVGRFPDLNYIQSRDSSPSTSRKLMKPRVMDDSPKEQHGEGWKEAGICGFFKRTLKAAMRPFLSLCKNKVEPFVPPLQPDTSSFNRGLSVPCAYSLEQGPDLGSCWLEDTSDACPDIDDSAAKVWSLLDQPSDTDSISGKTYELGKLYSTSPSDCKSQSDSWFPLNSTSKFSSPFDECGADQRKGVDTPMLFTLSSDSFSDWLEKSVSLTTDSRSSEISNKTYIVKNCTEGEPMKLDTDNGIKEGVAIQKKKTGICGVFKRKLKAAKQTIKQCLKKKVKPSPPLQPDTCPSNEAHFEPTEGGVESYYKLGALLGQGGYGVVCSGTRISDGKQVAIKVMSRQENKHDIVIPGHSRPLPLEVALLIKMNEPPISPYAIKMFEWFEEPKHIVIIMEYPQPCQGLDDLINRNCTLSEETARVIMRQTVQAVIDCVDHGVFHSDIHPGNILVNTSTLDIKLIDFGCGQLYTDEVQRHKYRGIKDYFPPEVVNNTTFHAIPTNVWCLGMLLYEMVNGYQSYVKSKEVQFVNPNLSEACRSLIRKCLARDPAERPTLQQILQHRWFNPE